MIVIDRLSKQANQIISPPVFRSLIANRALVWELTKRDFNARYKGSVGGVLWSFAQPVFLLAVYTLAFGVILRMRWSPSGSTHEYALILFAGLIIFNAFSECITRAPLLIISNPNYVKKVVFPLELLPVIQAFSTLINTSIAVLVWLGGYVIFFGLPHATFLLLPVVLAAYFPVLLAICWLVSSCAVYVRDLVHLAALVSHAMLFLSPVFYGLDTAPPVLRPFLALNPLTFPIEQFRAVVYSGVMPDFVGLALYFVVASIMAAASLWVFGRLRHHFADVL